MATSKKIIKEENKNELYMREAMMEAHKAYELGEVPIGCVIVYQDRIIGRGYNRRKTDQNTLSHAECTLYVTLEPCQMCAGAIVQARIPKVVQACRNVKAGCAGTIINLLQMPAFNHQVEIEEGVLEEECSLMLKEFFKALRQRVKVEKES